MKSGSTELCLNEQSLTVAEIEGLIRQREYARSQKDFKKSDIIREQLEANGIILEDGVQGTKWRKA